MHCFNLYEVLHILSCSFKKSGQGKNKLKNKLLSTDYIWRKCKKLQKYLWTKLK